MLAVDERALERDSTARVFVYCGSGHVHENPEIRPGGRDVVAVAAWLPEIPLRARAGLSDALEADKTFRDILGYRIYIDQNGNHHYDDGEGVPGFPVTVRTRGNSLQDQGAAAGQTNEKGDFDLSQHFTSLRSLVALTAPAEVEAPMDAAACCSCFFRSTTKIIGSMR